MWDRGEIFPSDACATLDVFGLPDYYVPTQYGGRLRSLDELMQLWRAVARHDLTVAIGHGKTFLGCVCVWLAGDRLQRSAVARDVLAGSPVSLGLTERDHGADLLASELRAVPNDDGWRIDGEKWLINNATRGQLMCVLARTGSARNPHGFSLFLIDKRRLRPETVRCLPKVRTSGIRGADISGIAFHDARAPHDALIGRASAGFEIVLKGLQLTRSACVGMSLGAADHAFHLTLGFVHERELYGRRLSDLPMARRVLGETLAMHYAAEAVACAVARAASWLPAEMGVMSAISKAFVPSTAEQLLGKLGELLGAGACLDPGHGHGHRLFQKVERDHRIVPIFDGSTVVNRQSLINHFPMLARGWRRRDHDADGIKRTFDISQTVSALPLDALALVSARGCSIVQALPASLDALSSEVVARRAPPELPVLASRLAVLAEDVMTWMARYELTARTVPAAAFEFARRYELCFAGAACIRFWLHERESATVAADPQAVWLRAALTWLIGEIDPRVADEHCGAIDSLGGNAIDNPAIWTDGISLWATRTDRGTNA
ncbi:acyl-CoA dehydrogenase [Paraburkholderia kururiensis]